MGVEKTLNDSRLSKANSIDLYRPPALRSQHSNSSEAADIRTAAIDIKPLSSSNAAAAAANTTTTTSLSCNNSPIHTNENSSNYDNVAVTSTNTNALIAQDSAATATIGSSSQQRQQQQQQTARRERRPDRALFIPRARRSQTTPPTATTTTTTAAAAPIPQQSQTTTAVMCNNVSANVVVGNSNISSSNNQQLAITSDTTTAASVSIAQSSKADEIADTNSGGSVVSVESSTSKKSKSNNASVNGGNNKERKERVKKSTKISKLSEKSDATAPTAVIIIAQSEEKQTLNNSKVTTNIDCDSEQPQQKTEVEKNEEDEENSKNLLRTKVENLQNTLFKSSPEQVSSTTTNQFDDITNEMNNREKYTPPASLNVVAVEAANLRIEDAVATNENARNVKPKCDIDEQEFQRASKEINRSNRRIIKQTFVSDVLEIPEKFNHQRRISSKISSSNRSGTFDSATEEEEEDDWENMFNESGECLDPKIIQELTASVGKVKIELPKMDYTAYLTKQSILNGEEFPHVLEVSNFPVEFKNQDLLMLFSQYKESGFDIKWVDDTHALAVFSSSRIAAEVLTMGHPFVVLKPLVEATAESRLKAKKCATSLQPYRARPETCAALARRLVTGALGVRLKTAAAERENEIRVLREAKERKLLAAKQRDEIWES